MLLSSLVFSLFTFMLQTPVLANEEASNKIPVKVAVYESSPFVTRTDTGEFDGFDIDIVESIAERENWEVEFVVVDRFSDLLPQVENGNVDFAASSITITPDRERVVDFSHPYMHTGLGILVSEDSDVPLHQVATSWVTTRVPLFIDLFVICCAFVVTLCIFGILLYVTDEQKKKDSADEDGLTVGEFIRGSANAVWLAFTTGSTIGYGDVVPKRPAARVIAILCFFSVAIVVGSLTASITSFNVIQQIDGGITGPEDLKGKTVATVSGTTSVPAATRYGATIKIYDNIDQAIASVILGNTDAVVYDEPRLRYFANGQGRRKTRMIESVFEAQDYGIAFVQGSNLLGSANVSLLSMRADGTISEMEGRHFGSK